MTPTAPTLAELTTLLKAEVERLGFDQVGIAPAVPAPGYPDYLRWLEAGYAGGMDYLERQSPARRGPENASLGPWTERHPVGVWYNDGFPVTPRSTL